MVNKNELEVVKKYEAQGWKTLRGGAPDFVFLKTDDGEIEDILFVEVKMQSDRLTYAQGLYRKILEKLGAKYKVETIQARPTQTNPSHPKPVQPTPNQPAPIRVTPILSVPNRTMPVLPEPSHTNPNHPIPDHPMPPQANPAHAAPTQAMPIQTNPDHTNTLHTMPNRTTPNQTRPFQKEVHFLSEIKDVDGLEPWRRKLLEIEAEARKEVKNDGTKL